MVYAKTRNPEWFDYRVYEDDIAENMIIDGGRDYGDINGDYLNKIKKMIEEYEGYDYEFYYHNSIKEFLVDMLPKKVNGKKYSPKEIHNIKSLLDTDYRYYSDYVQDIVVGCLSIIYGEEYEIFDLKGCCQGEWVHLYAPSNTKQAIVDYIEAIYFGTGTEVEIHDEDSEVNDANDICGYCFYTASYQDDDIKQEIATMCGCSKEEVVLFKFTGYHRVEDYERC